MQSKVCRFQRSRLLGFGFGLFALLATAAPVMAQQVDLDYGNSVNGDVKGLAMQPDSSLIFSGDFNKVDSITHLYVARVNYVSNMDQGFSPLVNDAVNAVVVKPDGKILIGGAFTFIGQDYRRSLVELNADGSLDSTTFPDINGTVYAMALQADGKILVVGSFDASIDGPPGGPYYDYRNIMRLNADGTLDKSFGTFLPSFNGTVTSTSGPVYAVAVQRDGEIVVGGDFWSCASVNRNNIARLNTDGTLDTTFDPNADDQVEAIAMQRDGKILVGGRFHSFAHNQNTPVIRDSLARLNSDGTVDTSFTTTINGWDVDTISLQTDGRMLVGGYFGSSAGDAKQFNVARLNANGALDASFDPSVNDQVFGLAQDKFGQLYLAGHFNDVDGELRNHTARVRISQSASQSLRIVSYANGSSIVTWHRTGSSPELSLPPELLYSDDGTNYAPVATMHAVNGGWRTTAFAPPMNQNFHLRARGRVSSGHGNGSSGLMETSKEFFLSSDDGIFHNGFE